MKDKEIQAINKLNNIFKDLPTSVIAQEINNNVQILVQGINELDQEVKQKTFEVLNREQLLAQRDQVIVQKDQKVGELQKTVFVDSLNKLHPTVYPVNFNEWTNDLPMKAYVDQNYIKGMEENNKIYKQQLIELRDLKIRQEFINNLHALHPKVYPANFNEWTNDLPMKAYVEQNYVKGMEENNKIYKQQLKGLRDKEVERLKAEEVRKEQLLIDKYKETKDLKALIAQKELEKQELLTQSKNVLTIKDQIIVDKDRETESLRNLLLQKELETQEILVQRELEKKELLAQKEVELANKSLAKNQLINELQDDVGLKEKETYKLQIELLTKQLEAAREIGKQKEINTELVEQNEILGLKMQYATKEARLRETEKDILLTQKEKLLSLLTQKDYELNNALLQKEIEQKELLIQKEMELADKSLIKNQVIDQLREEIADLNKQLSQNNIAYSIYLDEVGCQPGSSLFEKQLLESLDLSSINLSPINHGGQNQIVGNIIGNFDNQHITHSVVLGGEGSESFEIIQQESFH